MTFLSPGYLWLGLLLIVPLILYLLPLPRRRLMTAALYLWERFLEKEPFGKASEKMRRAVGFALLAAIFVCLVLAAAEMAVGRGAVTAQKVIVVMDNGASMNAVKRDAMEGGGRLSSLDRAKKAARELIASVNGGGEVAVIEAGAPMQTVAAMGVGRGEAERGVESIGPFDGDSRLQRTLSQTFDLWRNDPGAEVYVFTDRTLPANPWRTRAHAWIAQPAGDNVAIIDLEARRKGPEIQIKFTLANYGRSERTISGSLLVNGEVRGSFSRDLGAGKTTSPSLHLDEPAAAAIEVRIDGANDALAADDSGRAMVPALEAMRCAVVWPDQSEAGKGESKKKNEYVSAVLKALENEGVAGPILEDSANAPVTIYVNRLPESWPKRGGAIVLYPLKSGVIPVAGIHKDTLTVTHQVADPLLADVDLRGLVVKDAVQAEVPAWAHPLVWSNETPLVWAGETGGAAGGTKVLFVGIPVMPSGSRLPLVASFPVLLKNALTWMLPRVEVLRPGESAGDWSSRRAGFVADAMGNKHAVSVLSAEASDLRRSGEARGETFGSRSSLAMVLVMVAIGLLAVEWGLFHRRLTE